MKIELENLLTINNYSKRQGVTTSYIYKLIKQNKITPVIINGVKFIDKNKFSTLPIIQ